MICAAFLVLLTCSTALAHSVPESQAGQGEVAIQNRPLPLRLGTTEAGRFDKGEEVRYTISLDPGRYVISLTFSSVSRAAMILAGSLTLADDEGQDLVKLLQFDEQATEQSFTAKFSLSRGTTVVLKLRNNGGPASEYYRVDFSFGVRPENLRDSSSASAGALPAEHQ